MEGQSPTLSQKNLGNVMKILKFGGDVSHRPVSLFEKKKKNCGSQQGHKSRYQTFLVLSNFALLTLFQIFCLELYLIEKVLHDIQCYVSLHVTNNLTNLFC